MFNDLRPSNNEDCLHIAGMLVGDDEGLPLNVGFQSCLRRVDFLRGNHVFNRPTMLLDIVWGTQSSNCWYLINGRSITIINETFARPVFRNYCFTRAEI